ncbi:hypothetical protein ACFYUD_36290 [Nocardia tengchongensis]|uniref:hypothetical protein n=1 Tax=Nocardia tengchongensis TaxID=2055889 RepID=UPI0036928E27
MPQIFAIDQAATFTGVAFLQSTPKLGFQSDQQDTTADGRFKWEVQLVAGFRDNFGNATHEVIKVNVASVSDPGEGLNPYTPVHLINFVVGVVPAEMGTDRNGGQRIKGGSVWYRADEIRSTATTSGGRRSAASTE